MLGIDGILHNACGQVSLSAARYTIRRFTSEPLQTKQVYTTVTVEKGVKQSP